MRMTLAVALALLLGASRLVAQRADSTRADTSTRPFVRGGVYDKPFMSRLRGLAAIGGYAEAHSRYERVDGLRQQLGFEARRFNLFANARVSDVVRLGAELEVEDGGREITLEFAAIDVRIHPALTLRGGMLLSPIGRFNLAHDSPLNEFTDRPLVSTELLGVALSEPGLGGYGQFGLPRGGRLTWELYATNGFHDGLLLNSPEGTRLPLGADNFQDNNASPALVSRVAWSPRVGYELGVSAHRGAFNTWTAGGLDVDKRRSVHITALDGEATMWGATLTSEAAFIGVDVPNGLRGVYATRQAGVFAEVVRPFGRGWVRTIPTSTFAAKLRWDAVDFDRSTPGDSRVQLSAGINFRPNQDTAIKLDYVRGRSRDRFGNPAEHAFVLMSLATYF